jgi:hypothetical protein
VPIIKRFISEIEESGKYSGFCTLGISCQSTENIQLRECFGMRSEMTGVLVSRINPLSDAHRILKKDDILLEFDGVPIANDGTGEHQNFHICSTSIYALATTLFCRFLVLNCLFCFMHCLCICYGILHFYSILLVHVLHTCLFSELVIIRY